MNMRGTAVFENINVTDSFKNSISNALSQGRLSHAVILEGASESDALSAAGEIACYLQCTGENKPCGVCSGCVKCKNGTHPDIHILTRKAGSSMIKVDEIRELKKKATVLPNDSGKSVFIIVGAEFMNPQAQNALLKIFEEPAKHVCFILTCESKSSLLDTVISRATSYTLGESGKISTEKADSKSAELAKELVNIYTSGSEFDFLRKTSAFQKNKTLFKDTVNDIIPIVRDALILRSGGKDLITHEKALAEKLQSVLTQSKIIKLLEQLQTISEQAENSANHNLIITRFSSILYSIKTN